MLLRSQLGFLREMVYNMKIKVTVGGGAIWNNIQ